jgi:hypothetical protein
MSLGQMQVDGSDLEVSMAEQYLDGAQVGAGFEKMRGEAVTKLPRQPQMLVRCTRMRPPPQRLRSSRPVFTNVFASLGRKTGNPDIKGLLPNWPPHTQNPEIKLNIPSQ